jgi:hypothetical protein
VKPTIFHRADMNPDSPKLNMSVPHSEIRARLDAIGYHDPATSGKALSDMETIVVNLRLGKLMISRKVIDAHGNEGIFTAFKK